jgi:hypothetical protein
MMPPLAEREWCREVPLLVHVVTNAHRTSFDLSEELAACIQHDRHDFLVLSFGLLLLCEHFQPLFCTWVFKNARYISLINPLQSELLAQRLVRASDLEKTSRSEIGFQGLSI